jgi:hypothetical protein
MSDTEPQTAGGKVLWHFTVSLDGFVAGPNHFPDASSVYGGAWTGPVFVLTHHPEDATPAAGVTFLNCGPGRGGADRAGGGRRQEPRGVLAHHRPSASGAGTDRRDRPPHRPVLFGEGIRLYDNPGGEPIHLHGVGEGDPTSAVNVRYRPTTTAKLPTESVSGN